MFLSVFLFNMFMYSFVPCCSGLSSLFVSVRAYTCVHCIVLLVLLVLTLFYAALSSVSPSLYMLYTHDLVRSFYVSCPPTYLPTYSPTPTSTCLHLPTPTLRLPTPTYTYLHLHTHLPTYLPITSHLSPITDSLLPITYYI